MFGRSAQGVQGVSDGDNNCSVTNGGPYLHGGIKNATQDEKDGGKTEKREGKKERRDIGTLTSWYAP